MKLADEKAVARANPGMGNKYAMKKALDNLSQARNVTQANNIDNDVKWTKSADVFLKKIARRSSKWFQRRKI